MSDPSLPSRGWEQPRKFLSDWQWNSDADPFNGDYHSRRGAVLQLLTDYRAAGDAARADDARQIAALKEELTAAVLIRDRNAEDCENGVVLLQAKDRELTASRAEVERLTQENNKLLAFLGDASPKAEKARRQMEADMAELQQLRQQEAK